MKIVIKILNLVYLAIAAVAITCFLTKPYIDIDGGYKLQPSQITQMVKDSGKNDIDEEEIKEIVGETSVDVKVKAKVEVKYVLKFTDKEGLKNSIAVPLEDTKADVQNQIEPILKKVVKKTAINITKKVVREAIENKILELRPGSDAKLIMDTAGLTDNYFETFANDVFQYVEESTDITVSDVMTNKVAGKMLEVTTMLKENGGMGEITDVSLIANQMTEKIETEMKAKFLENDFCDETYKIRPIYQKINEKVKEKLDTTVDEFSTSFSKYSLYYFIALVAFIAPWLALAIISIIRIIRRKKCWVKSWYVFAFAAVQLLSGIVLTIAATKFLPNVAGVLPLEDFKEVLGSLSFSTLVTSSFIPSILYLALIPFTIVYMIVAHRTKKNYKKEKREAKRS